ncbi:MAG: D-alanine--D-alanine ligase [Pseudomonadales bacterium]|nr:D-alanine--D-alanine ligase [Pseudomonadales bacterium]
MLDATWQNNLQGKVAVLMGGTASEREISLQSGAAVLRALQQLGVRAEAFDTANDLLATFTQSPPSLAFIAVHGAGGEDGKLQAVLEYLRIPYTGSGVLASALAMDKLRSKQLWSGMPLATPNFAILDELDALVSVADTAAVARYEAVLNDLGGQVFVKPVAEGSSFGMSIARSAAELQKAHAAARAYGQPVMAESLVRGPEYTVAIINGRCLPAICIETPNTFYDFDAKYAADDTQYLIPCGLDAAREQKLQQLAIQAFNALGCSGWGRVDIMCDAASGEFYLLEVNTVPGLTDHSLVPMAAAADGWSFADLISEICSAALRTEGERSC